MMATILALSLGAAGGCLGPDDPIELGAVGWRRDHAEAFAEARNQKKPVLLLFQEIPG